MSARWSMMRLPEYRSPGFDPIFGNVAHAEFEPSYRSIVMDEPIGKFTDEPNVEFYGGHLACESVASREVGEIIIRALNAALESGDLK